MDVFDVFLPASSLCTTVFTHHLCPAVSKGEFHVFFFHALRNKKKKTVLPVGREHLGGGGWRIEMEILKILRRLLSYLNPDLLG